MERQGGQQEQEESGASAGPCPSSPSSASSEGASCPLCPEPEKAPASAAAAALLARRHSKKRFGLKIFGRRKAIAKSGLQHMVAQPVPTLALRSDSEREIRSTVDWSEGAIYGEHIWFETNVSGDFCYVGEQNCVAKMLQKPLSKRKCAACKIVVHTPCIEQLEKINFRCKPSFRESGSRNIREPTIVRHHWVHRRRQEGKCRQCGKYHSKVSCFMLQHIEEPCSLGAHAAVVIPPTWILRVRHPQNPLKSSKKKKRTSFKRKSSKKGPEVRDCVRVGGGLRSRKVSGTKQKVDVEKDRESMRTCESCFGRI